MSINFSDLSRGLVIELEDTPRQVNEQMREKATRRAPVTRITMRNPITGAVVERTFQRYDTAFSLADMDTRNTQ